MDHRGGRCSCSPVPALAQAQLTAADIQRLQDSVYDAARTCRGCGSAMRGSRKSSQRELDDLRDEVIYLKVKLRKNRA